MRSLRLSVRTSGFQPGKRGSIPLGTTKLLKSHNLFVPGGIMDFFSEKVRIISITLCCIKTARELECDESGEAFESTLEKILKG